MSTRSRNAVKTVVFRPTRARSTTPVRRQLPQTVGASNASLGRLFRRAVQAVSAPITAITGGGGAALTVARNSTNAAWMGSIKDNQYASLESSAKSPDPVRVLDTILLRLKNWLGSTALSGVTNPIFDWTLANEQLLIGAFIVTAGMLAGRRSIPFYYILAAVLIVICAPALSTIGYVSVAGLIYATLKPMPVGERFIIYAVAGYFLYTAMPAAELDAFEKFYAGKANASLVLPVGHSGKAFQAGLPNSGQSTG